MSKVNYWDIVNECRTHEDVARAEKVLKEAKDIDNEEYNDLMMSLAYISRELYHR